MYETSESDVKVKRRRDRCVQYVRDEPDIRARYARRVVLVDRSTAPHR